MGPLFLYCCNIDQVHQNRLACSFWKVCVDFSLLPILVGILYSKNIDITYLHRHNMWLHDILGLSLYSILLKAVFREFDKEIKSLTSIYFVELFWGGSLCDVIAMTSQRDPTQNQMTFKIGLQSDWLLMRESENFFQVGQIKIIKGHRL